MAIVMEDFGELAYGGLVTLTEWYDTKRVADATIAKKDILKKFSFYTYLVIGLGATLMGIFHTWKGQDKWMEHISHGFIYDLPRQSFNMVQALRTPPGASTTGADSAAVRQAREILARKSAQINAAKNAGRGVGDEVYVESGLRGMT